MKQRSFQPVQGVPAITPSRASGVSSETDPPSSAPTPGNAPSHGPAEKYEVRSARDGSIMRDVLVRYVHRISNDGMSFVPCKSDRPGDTDRLIIVSRLSMTYHTWIASDGMSHYVAKLIPRPPGEDAPEHITDIIYKYARHTEDCPPPPAPCTCGLEKLYAKYPEP